MRFLNIRVSQERNVTNPIESAARCELAGPGDGTRGGAAAAVTIQDRG